MKTLEEIIKETEQDCRKQFLKEVLPTLSFKNKLNLTNSRITEFLTYCKKNNLTPKISFSGGKDSCVIAHLVRQQDSTIECITAAEIFHPENYKIIKQTPNLKMYPALQTFEWVIKNYGYPIISKEVAQRITAVRKSKLLGNWLKASFGLKNKNVHISKKYLHLLDTEFNPDIEVSNLCCHYIKGGIKKDNSPTIVGTTIEESVMRLTGWIKTGCISYNNKPICRPISMWSAKEVMDYLRNEKINYSNAYNMGWTRTGCVACGFGTNIEHMLKKRNPSYKTRFELLRENYPQMYDHFMYKVGMSKALAMAGVDVYGDPIHNKVYQDIKVKTDEWYNKLNLKNNIIKILKQVEARTGGKFSEEERKLILDRYYKYK